MSKLNPISLHNKLYITYDLVLTDVIKIIDIYHYSKDEITEIIDFTLNSVEDVLLFQEKLKLLFQNYKSVRINEIIQADELEEMLSQYSFTPKNMLIEDEKIQFQTVETLSNLIETLYKHTKSLQKINFDDFKYHIDKIKEYVDTKFNLNIENYTKINEKISTISQQLNEILEKNNQLENEKVIQQKGVKKNLSKINKLSLKKNKSYENINKLKLQIKEIINKEKVLDIKTKQLLTKKKNNSILISKPLLLLSFGFLYYSSLNSYEKQLNKIKEKEVSLQLTKEIKKNEIEEYEIEIEEFEFEIKKLNSKFSEENISKISKNLLKNEEKIQELTSKKAYLKSEYDSLIKENISLQPLTSEILIQEIKLLIENINNANQNIFNYYNNLNSCNHNFQIGVYCLK